MIALATSAALLAGLVIGILLGAGLQAGWSISEVATRWQTLIAAVITVTFAAFGLLVAMRQLRINAASREEDRIEHSLPGLQEAANFLARINNSLVHSVAFASKKVLDDLCGRKPDESIDVVVARNVPEADSNTQQRISKVLKELYWCIGKFQEGAERIGQAREKFNLMSNLAPELHAGIRKEVHDAQNAFDLAGLEARKIIVRSQELEVEFAAEISRLEVRLLKDRAEIEG
jgi:hypothetical protein